MVVLYIGDIMAQAGLAVIEQVLPEIKDEHKPDFVIAQAENVSNGRGISVHDMRLLQSLGIDFFTGGNWTGFLPEIWSFLADESEPIIGPANFTAACQPGYKYLTKNEQTILCISLLGQVVGRKLPEISNPLEKIDQILEQAEPADGIIVNFHGDFSSEKKVIGYYLDGRVSLVVGDHWHIPSADAMVLPKRTAHITDVGMSGSLHSSLGVDLDLAIKRWQTGQSLKNEFDNNKPWQFNAVLVEIDKRGLANDIQRINRIIE